ncbi:MAG TPA: phosphoglycerate kinase [Candidatus Yonathbacteria bacterium]|nr:phosphoglycerate kinase [Candidatus Yonathbacteria bacterium]
MKKAKNIKSIKEIGDIKGKIVLLRLGLNVPLINNKVEDDFRIKKTIPTIKYLKKLGAKIVIISHIGRDKNESLKPVARHMNKYVKVGFVPKVFGDDVHKMIKKMKNGTVIMLENLRSLSGEVSNSKTFAKKLASMGEIYVNDAFSVSHRAHASIVGLPKLLPSFAGFLMEEEIKNLSIALSPKHPFLFILGGAKFKTKVPLIKKYLSIADYVFVGGALANNFFKALNFNMASSLTEKTDVDIKGLLNSKKLLLPSDVVVKNGEKVSVKRPGEVSAGDVVVDIGPESVEEIGKLVTKSKLVIFNGPLGNYKIGFGKSTKKTLKNIANTKTVSIIGGGDTAYMVNRARSYKKYTFVSTGGGATIEFLAKGTLPGIEALGSLISK